MLACGCVLWVCGQWGVGRVREKTRVATWAADLFLAIYTFRCSLRAADHPGGHVCKSAVPCARHPPLLLCTRMSAVAARFLHHTTTSLATLTTRATLASTSTCTCTHACTRTPYYLLTRLTALTTSRATPALLPHHHIHHNRHHTRGLSTHTTPATMSSEESKTAAPAASTLVFRQLFDREVRGCAGVCVWGVGAWVGCGCVGAWMCMCMCVWACTCMMARACVCACARVCDHVRACT